MSRRATMPRSSAFGAKQCGRQVLHGRTHDRVGGHASDGTRDHAAREDGGKEEAHR